MCFLNTVKKESAETYLCSYQSQSALAAIWTVPEKFAGAFKRSHYKEEKRNKPKQWEEQKDEI